MEFFNHSSPYETTFWNGQLDLILILFFFLVDAIKSDF